MGGQSFVTSFSYNTCHGANTSLSSDLVKKGPGSAHSDDADLISIQHRERSENCKQLLKLSWLATEYWASQLSTNAAPIHPSQAPCVVAELGRETLYTVSLNVDTQQRCTSSSGTAAAAVMAGTATRKRKLDDWEPKQV